MSRDGGAGLTRRGKQEVDDVRVLVVEDESYLADAIALGLRRETMAVDVVGNGAEALAQVEFTDYEIRCSHANFLTDPGAIFLTINSTGNRFKP